MEDCLIAVRVDPITNSQTKRRLIKSPKYLFFDLGIRRACANEGIKLPKEILGNLFENYVGNELIYRSQLMTPPLKVKYWRDAAGPEIDYILDVSRHYIPIEVKWSDHPSMTDAKHLHKFIQEHEEAHYGYIICQTPQTYKISKEITAIPWQNIHTIFDGIANQ